MATKDTGYKLPTQAEIANMSSDDLRASSETLQKDIDNDKMSIATKKKVMKKIADMIPKAEALEAKKALEHRKFELGGKLIFLFPQLAPGAEGETAFEDLVQYDDRKNIFGYLAKTPILELDDAAYKKLLAAREEEMAKRQKFLEAKKRKEEAAAEDASQAGNGTGV